MKKTEEKAIIMYDSPEAAKPCTMNLWVSADGRFWRTEDSARYAGCTHNICDCGKPKDKTYIKCESCRAVDRTERYNAMEFQEWDGNTPLVIFGTDQYFFNQDEINDYCYEQCENEESDSVNLKLVICEPNKYHGIGQDYWEDVLPEDGEVDKNLKIKLAELNAFIESLPPASWREGKIRTSFLYEHQRTQNQK